MTNISDIYDSLHTNVTSVLTSHTRITDPYNLDQNNDQFIRLGYGIAVLPGEKVNREICNKIWWSQPFAIPVTRKVVAREFDAVGKGTGEKNLLEDLYLLKNLFYKQDLQITGANRVNVLTDGGIEFIHTDKMSFVAMSLNIEVEYFETLT